jgi:anti-sigma B factor antagonist
VFPFGTVGADVDPGVVLGVTVELDGSTALLVASGDIDMYTVPLLRAAVDEAFAADPETVVLDFTGVTFLASSGLAVLMEALNESRRRRCLLRLVGDSSVVRRPLEITGFGRFFPS